MNKWMMRLLAGVVVMGVVDHGYAQLAQGEKDTILIGQLLVKDSVKSVSQKAGTELSLSRIVDTVDAQLTAAMNATRVFQIVERKRKGDLELEQAFAAVAVDANDKNAAQTLKMAGAKYAFLPQIDGFEDRSETVDYQQIGRSSMKRRLDLSVTVQIVDTTTGKLLPDSPSVQLSKSENIELARTGQTEGSDKVLVELAKEMSSKLAQGCVNMLRPAKILTVTGKQALINRGTDAGFGVHDIVEIYATQDIQDEDTGETFRNEVAVGRATIVRGDSKQSFAMINGEDLGIAKGCVVRVIRTAEEPGESAPVGAGGEETTPGSSEAPVKF